MEILAYALFILVMMVPFIIVLVIGGGLVGGLTLLASGVRTGNLLLVLLAVLLLLASTAAAWLAYRWMASWEVGEARIEKLKPLPQSAARRPRTMQVGLQSGFQDPIRLMLAGSIDRLSGDRRSLPMPRPTDRNMATGDFLDAWFLATLTDRECAERALRDGTDLHPCLTFTQVPQRPRQPHFGISSETWTKGYASQLYFLDEWPSVTLYRCEVPVRKPLLPFFTRRFERQGGLSLALTRLRECQAEAIDRLSADLGMRS